MRRALLLFLIALPTGGCGDQPSEGGEGVNVLLVTVDSLRADRLGCYGYERSLTPHLDALAQEGVRFSRAYTHAPFTPPAHASLLTGLNVESHGILGWGDTLGPDAATLGERFSEAGWRTGCFYNHPGMRPANVERGFQERQVRMFEEAQKTVDAFEGWLDGGQGAFCAWVHLWDVHRPYGWRDWRPEHFRPQASGSLVALDRDPLTLSYAEQTYQASADERVGRIERHYNVTPQERRRPLALEDSGADPRVFTAQDWQAIEERYDRGVSYVDGGLGELFDLLRERGLWENTLVIVTADHGESLRERQAVWFTHDPFVFEETLHVPLIVKFPAGEHAQLNAAEDVSGLVRGIDVLPTILEVCDVRARGNEQGESLLEVVSGARSGSGALLARTQTRHAKESEASVPRDQTGWLEERHALIEGSLKLVRDESADTWSLFDLEADPGEQHDLAGDAARADQLEQLREHLQQLRTGLPRPGAQAIELDPEIADILRGIGYTGDAEDEPSTD